MNAVDKLKQMVLDLSSLDPEEVEHIDIHVRMRGKAETVTLNLSAAAPVPSMITDIHARLETEARMYKNASDAYYKGMMSACDERDAAQAEVTRLQRTVDRKDEQMAELQEALEKAQKESEENAGYYQEMGQAYHEAKAHADAAERERDRMRPLVDAAVEWGKADYGDPNEFVAEAGLLDALRDYRAAPASPATATKADVVVEVSTKEAIAALRAAERRIAELEAMTITEEESDYLCAKLDPAYVPKSLLRKLWTNADETPKISAEEVEEAMAAGTVTITKIDDSLDSHKEGK